MGDDDNEKIKFCSDCQKEVYLCETDEDLARNIIFKTTVYCD
jgi:hypothetical protein